MTVPQGAASVTPGMAATYSKPVTDADIAIFALITGDEHPLHLDEAFAEASPYGGRMVPAALMIGLVEAALTRALPGVLAILGSVSLTFTAPAFVDSLLTVRMTVREVWVAEQRATCDVRVFSATSPVACGQLLLALSDLPPPALEIER